MVRAFRPFAVRDYRILASALAISVFGHGLWAVAMVYQVRALGGGPIQLSLVATATSIGMLLFVLVGGIAADRLRCGRCCSRRPGQPLRARSSPR